jgi:hypothetical protein
VLLILTKFICKTYGVAKLKAETSETYEAGIRTIPRGLRGHGQINLRRAINISIVLLATVLCLPFKVSSGEHSFTKRKAVKTD